MKPVSKSRLIFQTIIMDFPQNLELIIVWKSPLIKIF